MRFFKSIILCVAIVTQAVHAKAEESCLDELLSIPRLGIGILAETQDGELSLALAPYVGVGHREVIEQLNNKHSVRKILWMGEARYESSTDGHPVLLEANETSGCFFSYKNGFEPCRFIFENHIGNLPKKILSRNFVGLEFDPKHQHLVPEINGQANSRHGLHTALQLIFMTYNLVSRGWATGKVDGIANSLGGERRNDVESVLWLLEYLDVIGNLDIREYQALRQVLCMFRNGQWVEIAGRQDRSAVEAQMAQLIERFRSLSQSREVLVFRILNRRQ